MTPLPLTLDGILAMGRACLGPLVRYYVHQMGLGSWSITARWVDSITDDEGGSAVGCCAPDPQYQQAQIEILWPPPGDVEQTIAHEVGHCQTAKLALLKGAAPGTYARDAWEEIVEQNARGYVATRRGHLRSDVTILARAARLRVTAAMAKGRTGMGIQLSEEQARAMLAALKGEGDPAAAMAVLEELLLAALAGTGSDSSEATIEKPPMAEARPTGEEQEPEYVRAMRAQLDTLASAVSKLAPAPAPPVTEATLPQRQVLTRTILAAHRGLLSPEAERDLVARGDHDGAERMINEVQRHAVIAGRQPSDVKPPQDKRATVLSPEQSRAVARHKIKPDRFAEVHAQRLNGRAALTGRKV